MKSLINFSHLKYFCDAVIYNSISEAAKMNYVSQSAVSQGISKLEIVIGAPLIVHARQKFQLTEEGKIVFEQARHIFKAVDNIYDKINRTKEEVTGTVKFVTTSGLGMSFIAPLYKQMQITLPQVKMQFLSGGLNFIRTSLKQADAEFAIVVYDQDFSQYNKHTLKKGLFNLYQSIDASHHLIEDGVLVDHKEGMFVNNLFEHFAETDRAHLKIQSELAGWEIVARFTEMNLGIGFFPDFIVANNRYPTLKTLPIKLPSFEYEICVIHNKGEKLSRAASAFIDQFTLD